MEFVKGFDVSTLLEVEACGGRFYDMGVQRDALEILKSYGGNWVRLRVWNDPYSENKESYGAGECSLERMLILAKRAKALGMEWLLDLHYSDFWADPGKQTIPKEWQKDIEEFLTGRTDIFAQNKAAVAFLEQSVYDYTKRVLEICRAQGCLPGMVQVGNELSNGLLWPYGRVPEYENLARFVNAGVRAVREISKELRVMVHLDNGGNSELYERWFDRFRDNGGDWDVIGLSYYPFWHGSLEDLRANMENIAARYGKELMLAEVSMGYTTQDYAEYEKLPERKGAPTRPELTAKVPYPMTPQGQADFIRAVLEVLAKIPGGKGKGFFWWEPAWIPVPGSGWATRPGWEYVHEKGPGGNEWANQALFDFDGNTLPALGVIRDF